MDGRLVDVADGVWLVDGPNVDFFGFAYPTRMVVVRLDGGLWVWSPIALDDGLRAAIDGLGVVRDVVEPNKIHHLALSAWQAAWPEARVWGTPALIAKRPDVRFAGALGDEPRPEWGDAVDCVTFRGAAMDEVVFFHRPSRTAIFGDLIENFEESWLREHWGSRWMFLARVGGVVAPDGRAPLDYRLSFVRKGQPREALARVLAWDPETVLMAHGTWVPRGGRAFVERSFSWLGTP